MSRTRRRRFTKTRAGALPPRARRIPVTWGCGCPDVARLAPSADRSALEASYQARRCRVCVANDAMFARADCGAGRD